MSLSGNFVEAEQALRAGLATEVVPHETLLPRTLEVASAVAGNDPPGVRTLLRAHRDVEAHLLEPALAVEQATSQAWMAGFEPSTVAERRADVIGRGRSQARP